MSSKSKKLSRVQSTVMGRLLSMPDKGMHSVTGTKGVLAHLWRRLLWVTGTDPGRWDLLSRRFVKRYANGTDSSLGQNTARALAAPEITWASLNRGLVILGAVEVETTLTATLATGRQVTVTVKHKLDVDEGDLFMEPGAESKDTTPTPAPTISLKDDPAA